LPRHSGGNIKNAGSSQERRLSQKQKRKEIFSRGLYPREGEGKVLSNRKAPKSYNVSAGKNRYPAVEKSGRPKWHRNSSFQR